MPLDAGCNLFIGDLDKKLLKSSLMILNLNFFILIFKPGMPMRPRPVQPVYNGGDDMYIDDYEDPPIEHSRKEWARQSYRQEWRMDRKKR